MPHEKRAQRAAEANLNLGEARFRLLSGQVKDAYAKLDDTMVHALRMNAAMIETAQEIGLEPETGQKLFEGLHTCVATMVSSRQQLLEAHFQATKIRMRTEQAAALEGCWGFIGAEKSSDKVVSIAA